MIYKVKNPATAAAARFAMKPHVETFPGFLGWTAVTALDDPSLFTDILTWRTHADAKSAGEKVMADPQCAPLMVEVTQVVSMGHYAKLR